VARPFVAWRYGNDARDINRKCSSRAKGKHECPEAGIGRDQSQHVASLRRAGDQSKHGRPIEARNTIGADVCSTGFTDRIPVEQHGDRRFPPMAPVP
jgi:hypothetical protein